MIQTLNKVRYIQLLKKDQILKSQKSCLNKEDKAEFRELLSYGIILSNQIIYNRKEDYISLVEYYLTNEINSFMFTIQFFKLQREHNNMVQIFKNGFENDFEQLSKVLIDPKSGEFSELINDLFYVCEFLKFDSEPEEDPGITEVQFRAFLEETFLKMKKYSDK